MISASSSRSHVSSSSVSNSVAWISLVSASRVLDMFSRRRRKKPRREPDPPACSSASAEAVEAVSPVRKRSRQSRAMAREDSGVIDVRTVPSDQPPATDIVEAMVAEVSELYGRIDVPGAPSATPIDFAPPGGSFIVIFDDGVPVAGGGLKRLDD